MMTVLVEKLELREFPTFPPINNSRQKRETKLISFLFFRLGTCQAPPLSQRLSMPPLCALSCFYDRHCRIAIDVSCTHFTCSLQGHTYNYVVPTDRSKQQNVVSRESSLCNSSLSRVSPLALSSASFFEMVSLLTIGRAEQDCGTKYIIDQHPRGFPSVRLGCAG